MVTAKLQTPWLVKCVVLLFLVFNCIDFAYAGCSDTTDGCDIGFAATPCQTSTCCVACNTTTPTSSPNVVVAVNCNVNLPVVIDCAASATAVDLQMLFQNPDSNCVPGFSIQNGCAASISNNQYLARASGTMCNNVTCVIGVELAGPNCLTSCSTLSNNQITFLADTQAPTIDTTQDPYPPTLQTCSDLQNLKADLDANAAWLFNTSADSCSGVSNIATTANYTIGNPCGTTQIVFLTRSISDVCGNTAVYTSSYALIDTTPPQVVSPNINPFVSYTCTTNARLQDVVMVANDGALCIVSIGTQQQQQQQTFIRAINTDQTLAYTCANQVTILRSWNVSDTCGNFAIVNQTITTSDTTAPTAVPPVIPILQCRNQIGTYLSPLAADDNCDGIVQTSTGVDTYIANNSTPSCINRGTGVVQWTTNDTCGNSGAISTPYIVADTTPPFIVGVNPPLIQRVQCTADITIPSVLQLQDNCLGSWYAQPSSETIVSNGCSQRYTLTRTWQVTDNCTAASSVTSTVYVSDTQPPVFNSTLIGPVTQTLQCRTQIPTIDTLPAAAMDRCYGQIQPNVTDTIITQDKKCANRATIRRVWEASDACGNKASYAQTFFISDTQGPKLVSNHSLWSQSCVWPINNMYVCFTNISSHLRAWQQDNCDTEIRPQIQNCVAWDCTSSDASACTLIAKPQKATKPVCVISAINDMFCIRSERIAAGKARLYKVDIAGTDACGNAAEKISLSLLVPGSNPADQNKQGKTPCGDRAMIYVPTQTNQTATSQFGIMFAANNLAIPNVSSGTILAATSIVVLLLQCVFMVLLLY